MEAKEVKTPVKRTRKRTTVKAKETPKVNKTVKATTKVTKRTVTVDPKTKVKVTRLPSGLVVTSK